MYSSWKILLASIAIWALSAQLVHVSALEEVSDGSSLQKRDPHHSLRARQAPAPKPDPKKAAGVQPLPGEEAAGQLIAMLIQVGEALDATTHMGSNATIVKLASEAVIQMLPEIKLARERVLKAANKDANDDSGRRLVAATDKMSVILTNIKTKPEDSCNLIKSNYAALTQAFGDVFSVSEAGINVVIPAKAADPVDPKKLKVNAPPRF
ncbi:hypothetical protein PCANC_03148 [Puccinia coronata f. sp. avenae]|uniref:Cell wall protein n=1 Tax=Puccinia coronata f. sp. avenae TaxID=200324 RepID=A0A2N5T805_9BASI|nr:hypothetical protein PCANC_03148 [Puccinia coronata f. sp. avenae]